MDKTAVEKLRTALGVAQSDVADDDASVVIQSLLVGATQDADVQSALQRLNDALVSSGSAPEADVLSAIPLLLPLPEKAASELLDTLGREASAKELLIAVQEVVENIVARASTEDDGALLGEVDLPSSKANANATQQIARLIKIYGQAIPRLRKGKRSPEDILRPVLSQVKAMLSLTHSAAGEDVAHDILRTTLDMVQSAAKWSHEAASGSSAELLYNFTVEALGVFARFTGANIAQRTFEQQHPRLVVPHLHPEEKHNSPADIAGDAWIILGTFTNPKDRVEETASLGNLILLAHSPITPSLETTRTFLPGILTAIQTNEGLEEALAILLKTLAPLRQARSSDLPSDLALPLVHLLPHLAAAHPDATLRHIAFRVLGLILMLLPSALRMQLLKDLLTDPDTPEQMHISGVALVKEAVLEELGSDAGGERAFASPKFMEVLGPVLFEPRIPPTRDVEDSLEQFLQSPEPLRLVECFGLVYVLLLRDQQNKTGIRTAGSLKQLRKGFVQPVGDCLNAWRQIDLTESEDAGMQLEILNMWVGRVMSVIESLEKVQ